MVTGGLMPARTFVLVLGADAARGRQSGYLDRIEREDDEFRGVVSEGYRQLASLFPERVTLLDGSESPERDRGAGT